jgi:hypothetical protein
VPVIRSALRIELPSTKQLMTWVRRASGTRFMSGSIDNMAIIRLDRHLVYQDG